MIGFAPQYRRQRILTVLAALVLMLVASTTLYAQSTGDTERGTVTLTGARLNVRSAPDSTASIIGKLETGAIVTIHGVSADEAWLRVTAEAISGEGWVSAAYVAIGGDAGAEPTSVPAEVSSAPTRVLSRGLSSAVTGTGLLPVATKPPVIAAQESTTPVSATSASTAAATPATTTAASALMPTPTPRATTGSALLPTATPVALATDAAAQATDTQSTDTQPTGIGDPIAKTLPTNMNLRGGPGTHYPVVGAVPAGTILYITGVTEANDWYRVNRADSTEAWVSAPLVQTSGAVDSIVMLVEDELPAAPVAAVAETVAASASTTSAAASSTSSVAVVAPAPAGFGEFGYGITASMWQGEKSSVANAIQDLGFNWVKQQVRWEYVEEAPGAVNWQEMDAIVNTMNGYGIHVAFSVVTSPAWTRPNWGGTGGPPEDFQLFANFVGAIAGRYCGQSLKAIEVWNEQNLQREWEGLPLSAASYMDLLKRSYGSIKAACPSMLVISGATTPAGNSDVAVDDIDYLRGMYENGLKDYSDGIGIHPSGFANPPSVRFSDWQNGSYNAESHVNHRSFYFLSTLEESRAVMIQYGDSAKRLWPTEFGWGSSAQPYAGYEYQRRVSEEQQANWTTEAYRIMANSGYVGVAFLWNLNYNHGEMQTFSIVGRPAYTALKAMMGR